MELNRKNAMKAWEDQFGKTVQAVDFAGRKIQKGAYDQKTSDFGWTLTYIIPKSEGGVVKPENIICVHIKTAEEKGDDYPMFTANDKKYGVKNEEGVLSIEEATDSESIAEQQAKVQAAMERWEQFFGDAESAIDFCGRKIIKSEYNTESELAWKIAPYVTSKPTENKNAYIANVLSVEEALGKTAFKANGKNYTLNKESGAYYFKSLEVKLQKKPFEVSDVDEVFERVRLCKESYQMIPNAMVWLDFIVVKIVTAPGFTSAAAATITDSISMLLKEQIGEKIAFEVSELVEENGSRYMFLTYRFSTPQRDALERVFNGCMLLNTYAPLFFREFDLEEFKIYNYANQFDVAQVQYPTSILAEYSPELKALMTAIYQSAYGFHEGESPVTLYVSDFIVYNIESLTEMHPENETTYYTDVNMTEHNYVFTDLRTEIQNKILAEIAEVEAAESGAQTAVATESVAEEEDAAANAADYSEYVKAAQETAEEPEQTVKAVKEEVVTETVAETEAVAEEKAEAPATENLVDEAKEEKVTEETSVTPEVKTYNSKIPTEDDDNSEPIETF